MSRRTVLIVLACLSIAYLAVLRKYISPYAGGSDSSGYLNFAALLQEGTIHTPARVIPGLGAPEWHGNLLKPLGFNVRDSELYPSYPAGLPLHLLAFAPLTGLDYAAIPLNLCVVILLAMLIYALGRRFGLERAWAGGVVATLAVCPLFFFYATQPMSDVLATFWTALAIYCALRSRERASWAILAGVAVSVVVWVRPAGLVVALPVVLAMGFQFRRWLLLALGGLPGAVLLVWLNAAMNGDPLQTGYRGVDVLFGGRFVPHNLAHFAQWLPILLTPALLLGLALPWTDSARTETKRVLGGWILAYVGFYVFYFHSGETWWYLRFILPAFPALLFAAALVAQWVWRRAGDSERGRRYALVLLCGVLCWEVVAIRKLHVLSFKPLEKTYPVTAEWLTAQVPANAVVLTMQTSGALFHYTGLRLVRWDELTPQTWEQLQRAASDNNFPLYAALYGFEEKEALGARAVGQWEKVETLRLATIWKYTGRLDSAQRDAATR